MTAKLRVLLGTTIFAVLVDQLAKYWVISRVPRGGEVDVIPGFFQITHLRNSGGAFGLVGQLPEELRVPAFLTIGVVVLGVIVFFYRDLAPGDRLAALALALILGGAVGNLADRLVRGEVVDFLHFRLVGGYAWPDFNFADAFIVLGVALLVIELLATEGTSRANLPRPGASD